MNREVHVRLREGLRGKFPRSTRLNPASALCLQTLMRLVHKTHVLWTPLPSPKMGW